MTVAAPGLISPWLGRFQRSDWLSLFELTTSFGAMKDVGCIKQILDGEGYKWECIWKVVGNPQLTFWCLQKTHPWCALVLYKAQLGFLKDHGTYWAKRLRDKIVNIQMFSQESLDHCPLDSECSARKLPDLKKSILTCRLIKCFEVLGVSLPQTFIINFPSEIWKILEVHHGALERKPFFQPNIPYQWASEEKTRLDVENFSGRNQISSSWLLQPWPVLGQGTPGFTGFLYSLELPGRLCCLPCKISPYCCVRHVEEKPFRFLIDSKRKTLSEETNLGMLQIKKLGTPLNPWNGPTLALKTFEVVHCIRCTVSPATDAVFACSVCHSSASSTWKILTMVMILCPFFVALTEDPNPLWSNFRDSGHRLISVPNFFRSRAASKSTFTRNFTLYQWCPSFCL